MMCCGARLARPCLAIIGEVLGFHCGNRGVGKKQVEAAPQGRLLKSTCLCRASM